MLCQICHRLEGEWQCQVCRRVVCTNDARPTSSGVYCIEHAPASKRATASREIREESGSEKAVKSAFFMLLILTIGLGFIIYIGQNFIDQFSSQYSDPNLSAVKGAMDSLQSVGNLILYFMIFLSAILGISWLALRSRRGR